MTVQACAFNDNLQGGGIDCAGAANLPACLLCPRSPGYWRNTPTTPADPDGGPQTPLVVERPDTVAYWPWENPKSPDARNSPGWHMGPETWCVQGCGAKTRLRSPKKVPLHMACAETWNRQHDRRNDAAQPDHTAAARLDGGA